MNRLLMILALFVICTSILPAQGFDVEDESRMVLMTNELQAAGFDIHDAESLRRAARDENSPVRQAAAYGFGKLPSSPEIFDQLLRLADDPDIAVAYMACDSLSAGKDKRWMIRARARLTSSNVQARVQLSGLLARAGDYTGWPLVREAITSAKGPEALAALLAARSFVGMQDSKGNEIDISKEVEVLAPRMMRTYQSEAERVRAEIRKDQSKPKAERRDAKFK